MKEELVQLARERIADSSLPRMGRFRTFGGQSTRKPCALCREIIPSDAVEIVVEFDDGHAELIFHTRCHAAWLVAFDRATVELPYCATDGQTAHRDNAPKDTQSKFDKLDCVRGIVVAFLLGGPFWVAVIAIIAVAA